jgi:acetamidase/formamidase
MLLSCVYAMKFEVCQQCFVLLSRVYVMKFEVCQQCFVLSRVYVMKFEVCQVNTEKITQSTADIPQISLHKLGTIT